MDRILVINPNSTETVTKGIDAAMEPLRMNGGPLIECVTLKDGPPGIESQAHVEQVVGPIGKMVTKRDNDCSAFVIACYSDPGLHAAREITTKPVLGIAECGILTAMTLGQRFGVISILKKSIPRHLRYVGQMGVADRMAGDRAIGLGVVELSNEATTFARMAEVAAELRDEDGADVLVIDHHLSDKELPQPNALVNPNRLDEAPDAAIHGNLAAVGVAFLLGLLVSRR